MTKTLTEQWREGKLPEGWYYIKVKSELANYPVIAECVINYSSLKPYSDFYEYDGRDIEEVLAPVPSYDEWQESQKKRALWFDERSKIRNRLEKKIKLLEEQLNYALETMGQVAKLSDNTVDAVQCAHAICLINERLKEMEGVMNIKHILRKDCENDIKLRSRIKREHFADLSKKVERLQEQLNEANEVIKYYTDYHYELNNKGKMVYKETNTASKYLEKYNII